MIGDYTKWVACWGNATSITDRQECCYAKDITLRYPVKMCFSGDRLRLHFSNLTGTENIEISGVTVENRGCFFDLSFGNNSSVTIEPGKEVCSDELLIDITAGDTIQVSMYFENYTQMNAGTLITGPLSGGKFSYGNYLYESTLPVKLTRNTHWHYFLNTIDICTKEDNYALICYGDSITAQSWPDYLSILCSKNGFENVSIIRRAVSGTRILREYDCITYAAYGLKGEKRFPIESKVAGAKTIILQHGINDIIHPVGTDVNIFRPMEDMPTAKELIEGICQLYIKPSADMGLKIYGGTLLPIEGWRTYAPFREEVREAFNAWLRNNELTDGCIDFDARLRDKNNKTAFAPRYDSGDHLHPSEEGYKEMAQLVFEQLLMHLNV